MAEDWPQWRGANRDGISSETGLLDSWPEAGPPVVWKAGTIGGGYAPPAIAGGKVFGTGYGDGEESVWALSEADGSEAWKTVVAKVNYDDIEAKYATGPRATPTVDGDHLFFLGATGDLACLETESGNVVWSKHLVKDFGGALMSEWGFSEAPLVDGDHLICTPGGEKGAVIALDKKTGDLVWQSKDLTDPAGYSSVVKAEICGKAQYVALTGASVAGINPEDGSVLWKAERAGKSFVVATPIVEGDQVFVTSADVGAHLYTISESGGSLSATEEYKSMKMKNDWGGAVKVGDHVYADNGSAFVCLDFKSGEGDRARLIGECGTLYAEGHLYLQNQDGIAALVEANPENLEVKSQFQQPEAEGKKVYSVPVIANGKLYLRALDQLVAYDIKKK